MTKIFNFALKIKGGVVGRVAHVKSSDPSTPQKKFGTCTTDQSSFQWNYVNSQLLNVLHLLL